ncbi:MAG: hypothetical protein J0G95_07910 [Rhizobiales bacterium]|nr:hypothetical protein [Hyphomicrobiales bacterium]
MSNVLTFPKSDRALEWIDSRPSLMELDTKRNDIQAVMDDVSKLRARVKLGVDDAISGLEQGHARLLKASHILEDHSFRTKLQSDLGELERLLKNAKSDLSDLLCQCV